MVTNEEAGGAMGTGALFIAVFLACVVEAVEATTIVLAAGDQRDGRSAGRARDRSRGARPGSLRPAAARAAPVRRRAAAGVWPAVAAQGDPAGERTQGAARRGQDF